MECAYTIRRITEDDWAQLRVLRLEMLADTPHAFLETLESARAEPEKEWRFRAARTTRPGSLGLAAVLDADGDGAGGDGAGGDSAGSGGGAGGGSGGDASGDWIGTMSSYLDLNGDAMLVSVYVTPRWRGAAKGLTDALLDAVETWARTEILEGQMLLHVHEDNPRARAFYARRGYVETGNTIPYPLDRSQREVEMALSLDA